MRTRMRAIFFARCRAAASLLGARRTCSCYVRRRRLWPRTAGLAAAAVTSWRHVLASVEQKRAGGAPAGPLGWARGGPFGPASTQSRNP